MKSGLKLAYLQHAKMLSMNITQTTVIVLMRDRTPITEALLAQLTKLKYIMFTGDRNG